MASKAKLTYFGSTKGGRVKLKNKDKFTREVASYFEDSDIVIDVYKKKRRRSLPQNAYYWGVIIVILTDYFKELGQVRNGDETHSILAYKFLKIVVIADQETGEIIERVRSTTELSTVEFCEYIDNIIEWAREMFNVKIPAPNEQTSIEY